MDLALTFVGSSSEGAMAKLKEAIESSYAKSYVRIVGSVGDSALKAFYEAADLFVFASSCETFGITLAEAMAMRLPIACSIHSGLPELLGDGGVYFDPKSVGEIKGALARLLKDESLRRQKGSAAFERSKEFSWKRTADATFTFLRSVAYHTM